MDLLALLSDGIWAGVMATACGVMFTVPRRALILCFAGGVTALVVQGLATTAGLPIVASTLVAAAMVSLVALGFSRRRTVVPAVALSALFPLGAAINALAIMTGILQILSATDQATRMGLVTEVSADLITTIAIFAAIGLGFTAPYLALRAKGEG